jgi:hypothetical protein
MATLAQGIVGGDMPWPLVVVGVMFGVVMIMGRVKSPMLVAVGMYLPINTTFAIFVGGVFRWVTDSMRKRAGFNEAQSARVENVGILVGFRTDCGRSANGTGDRDVPFLRMAAAEDFPRSFLYCRLHRDSFAGTLLVRLPLSKAGSPDEPAPPVAMM